LVPSSRVTIVDTSQQTAASWEIPPAFDARDGSFRLVGVPATVEALDADAAVEEGYGGVEVVQSVEAFSDQDLDDLERFIGPGARDNVLRLNDRSPTYISLSSMLQAPLYQREFASILTAFQPNRLAERTINSVSFAKRLLSRCRQFQAEVDAGTDRSVQVTLDLHAEIESLRREWTAMKHFWQEKLDRAQGATAKAETQFKTSYQRQAEDHEFVVKVLRDEASMLKDELYSARAQIEVLKRQVQDKTLGKWVFNDYCRDDPHVTVTGDFPRLNLLFKSCLDRVPMPSDTNTVLHIYSADRPQFQPAAYDVEKSQDPDTDNSNNPGGPASGPGSASETTTPNKLLNLSRLGPATKDVKTPVTKPSSKSKAKGRAQRVLTLDPELDSDRLQVRPKKFKPHQDQLARPASRALQSQE
ncbi:hypothetical protein PHYBOEH_000749, partial [Phytophthora boehmeriae]